MRVLSLWQVTEGKLYSLQENHHFSFRVLWLLNPMYLQLGMLAWHMFLDWSPWSWFPFVDAQLQYHCRQISFNAFTSFFFIIIIIIISSSLVSSEDLLDVSLLNSYMDVILGASRKQVIALTCSAKALKEVLLDTGWPSDSLSLVETACRRLLWRRGRAQSINKQGVSGGRQLSPKRPGPVSFVN